MDRSGIPLMSFRGFTLIEVLVSITVLLLLVGLLATMLGSVTTVWQQEEARGERRATAHQSLNFLARDLALTSLPLNHSDTNGLQFVIDPPASTLAGYLVPHALFWQAPIATDTISSANQGNLAEVGYFVRWVGTEACLCRLLINPSSGTPAGADYKIYSSPTTWLTAMSSASPSVNLLDYYASAASANSYAGLIGENVLGLWAQALDASGNPIVVTASGNTTVYASGAYDSRLGYSVSTNGVTHVFGPSALPAAVRIGIVVIDSRTAKRLTAPVLPAAPTTNFFGDIQTFTSSLAQPIRQGAESYTEVVPLPRSPQ